MSTKKVVGGDAVKIYSSRDGATAALRKIGVASPNYPLYLNKTTDGRWAANLTAAYEDGEKEKRKRTKKQAIVKQVAAQQRGKSVSSVCKQLILEGKSNAEVWDVVRKKFELGDDKKYYPAWNRSALRRNGELPKELDRGH